MAAITKQSKNSVSITNDEKTTNNLTVDDMTWAINEADGSSTVNSPKYTISKTQKNEVTLDLLAKETSRFDSAEFDDGKFV